MRFLSSAVLTNSNPENSPLVPWNSSFLGSVTFSSASKIGFPWIISSSSCNLCEKILHVYLPLLFHLCLSASCFVVARSASWKSHIHFICLRFITHPFTFLRTFRHIFTAFYLVTFQYLFSFFLLWFFFAHFWHILFHIYLSLIRPSWVLILIMKMST